MKAKPTLVSDVKELVVNGDFSAWTLDNPDGWSPDSESPPDREISEVGTGEGHGGTGTGLCNIYSSGAYVGLLQTITTIVGKRYKVSVDIDTVVDPSLQFDGGTAADPLRDFTVLLTEVKTYTLTFTAVATSTRLSFKRYGACDVTFDNVSVKPIRQRANV